MSSLETDLSRERVKVLLHSSWPISVDDADGWLSGASTGRLADPPTGSQITPVTVNTYEDRVSGFSWFASYPDPTHLIEAHDELRGLITALLGTPGIHEHESDHSGYWVTTRFAIETYAHDVSEREDGKPLRPTLQVNVADATLAASKEARARRAI